MSIKETQKKLDFKPLTLEDRDLLEPLIRAYDSRSCDYSFANNFIWSHAFNTEFALKHGFFCIRSGVEPFFYTNPAGNGDYGAFVESVIADAEERGIPLVMRGLLKEDTERLSSLFPDMFEIVENRDVFDYLYSVEALTNLSGKKHSGKRNHIARFMDNSDWSYEQISKKNIAECSAMNDEWCRRNDCKGNKALQRERISVRRFIEFFIVLGLEGGLLRLDGEVIAFTIGSPLSSDTFDIHVEKAFSDIQGAYPMINHQFLLSNCQSYRYVNREEDLGVEGLRRAKLSYHPEILLEKYTATRRKNHDTKC